MRLACATSPRHALTTDGRRSAAAVAAGILLSRIAGLAREVAVSAYLGIGVAADAFKAALRIPNLLQNLLGEGVLSASFIPVYARLVEDRDEEEAGRLAGAMAGLLLTFSGLLVVVGVVAARPLTIVLTPGFEGERLDLAVTLVRIIFPGVGFLVLSAWCLGVLSSHRRFFLSYVAPVLWNAAQIAVVVALAVSGASPRRLATGLAWGVAAGGALQFLVQLPAVRRVGRPLHLSLAAGRATVREVRRRFLPAVLGRGVVQIVGYVDLMLASLLAVGAVAAFTYSQVLYLLPVSLFGMSVAAAELPELARLGSDDDATGVRRERLDAGLARIAFYVVPTQVVYVLAGDLVVGALLQRGEFGAGDTRLVWLITAATSLALVATTTSRLVQSTLYAAGDTATPARIAVARVATAAMLGALLMFPLDRVVLDGPRFDNVEADGSFGPLPDDLRANETGRQHLGAVGLGLGAAVGAWLEFALLRRATRSRLPRIRIGGSQRTPILAGGAAAAVVVVVARQLLLDLAPIPGASIALVSAGAVYLAVTAALGVPEARALLKMRAR